MPDMRIVRSLTTSARIPRCFYYSFSRTSNLSPVETIVGQFNDVDIDEFRRKAFLPEKPLLITANNDLPAPLVATSISIPAAGKWFVPQRPQNRDSSQNSQDSLALSQSYLSPFSGTILPYELITDADPHSPQTLQNLQRQSDRGGHTELALYLSQILDDTCHATFHRFNAPFSLFLQACNPNSLLPIKRLYIAQAQIADLPKQLRDDLPTPKLVKEAGKGDVYDANIWLGIPPTYTPLHRDPNPNIFIQLASRKRVRLFTPDIGSAIFREVQQRIKQHASSKFRGNEMMEGPERIALEESTWGESASKDGFEVIVSPGDALFIPKGWWHSIKSIGSDLNASVNWWFR